MHDLSGRLFPPWTRIWNWGRKDTRRAVIRQAVHMAEGFASFAAASADVRESLDVALSPKHRERLCQRIGQGWTLSNAAISRPSHCPHPAAPVTSTARP
jgi:hypothetical protein